MNCKLKLSVWLSVIGALTILCSGHEVWHSSMDNSAIPFQKVGFINPPFGPLTEIYIEDVGSGRYKRHVEGLDYEIPDTCERVRTSTEKRVTKG